MSRRTTKISRWLLSAVCVLAPLAARAKAQFFIDPSTLACSKVISTMSGTTRAAVPRCTAVATATFGSFTYITKANCFTCTSSTPIPLSASATVGIGLNNGACPNFVTLTFDGGIMTGQVPYAYARIFGKTKVSSPPPAISTDGCDGIFTITGSGQFLC